MGFCLLGQNWLGIRGDLEGKGLKFWGTTRAVEVIENWISRFGLDQVTYIIIKFDWCYVGSRRFTNNWYMGRASGNKIMTGRSG